MSTVSSTEITKVINNLAVTDTKSVSADIKSTILFKTNWETLLTSAPIAIGALGACCVAANSPHLDRVELAPPASGKFTYLKWLDVSTNLLQCVDEGRSAFDVAHGSMSKIWDMVLMVDKTVIRIIGTLVDPQGAKDNLLDYMEELRNTAELCAQESVRIDDQFDKYLEFIKELSQACEQQQGLTTSKIKDTARDLDAENVRLAGQERATQAAEGLAKRMEQELTVASEAYKKASDEFPSGWDIVGQEVVKGLVDCVTTAVNTAIPVLMEHLSPMKKVQAATNILGDITKDAVDVVENIQNGPNTASTAAGALQSSAQFVADPAFSQIKKDMIWFNLLKEVLPAVPEGGVDWDKAKKKETAGKAKGKTFLSVVETGFAGAADGFSKLATDSEPSAKYVAALEGINEVVSDMNREIAEGEKSGAYIPPKAGNPMVAHWNDTFAEHYQTAIELCSASTSFPGNAPGGFPSVNPSTTLPQKDISKSLGVMEGATNRLRMTRDALIATQKNYLQSETLLIESRTKMADIQATITKLQSSTLKLDQVLEILGQSIRMVGTVKNNIAKLCRFFDAMATLITVMVTQQVQPFVKNLDTNLKRSEDGLVGALSWADSQKQAIYQSIVTIRSYFSAYGDVAGMWVKLSSENIIEGMDLLADVFTAAQEGESAAKARELEEWSARAQANIAKIARETQSKMKADMQARVEHLAKETARLPEPPKAAIKGLNKASEVAARTGRRMLEETPSEIVPIEW